MLTRMVQVLVIAGSTGLMIWAASPEAGWFYNSALILLGACFALLYGLGDSVSIATRRALRISGVVVSIAAIGASLAAGMPPSFFVPFLVSIGTFAVLGRRDRRPSPRPQGTEQDSDRVVHRPAGGQVSTRR